MWNTPPNFAIFHARISKPRRLIRPPGYRIPKFLNKQGERQLSDFYYDDPVEEASGTRRNFKNVLALILVIAVGGTYLQTTLAANINLNSGLVVNFGQGVSATTACSGSTSLVVTPASSFVNSSGGGAFYFSSVKVANIPSSCHGKDFTINAYNNSSNTPLAIFNSTSTSAVVYNNAGTFQLGAGTTVGASITSATGTFTLTFTTPVAAATSVFKLTIQSSNHAQIDGVYSVGDTGPGGGKIFYYSAAGFNCGASYSATGSPTGGKCNYLEVAPTLWSGLTASDYATSFELYVETQHASPEKDSPFPFAFGANQLQAADTPYSVSYDPAEGVLLVPEIGIGYRNSVRIATQNGPYNFSTKQYAAGAARAYSGGSKSDWYLPAFSELNLLCQWAKGIAQNATNLCGGGTSTIQPTQTGAGFEFLFTNDPDDYHVYAASSEDADPNYSGQWTWGQNMYSGATEAIEKNLNGRVRPIRAF